MFHASLFLGEFRKRHFVAKINADVILFLHLPVLLLLVLVLVLEINPVLSNRELESSPNPQAGKPALRNADILVCGYRGLSSPRIRSADVLADSSSIVT